MRWLRASWLLEDIVLGTCVNGGTETISIVQLTTECIELRRKIVRGDGCSSCVLFDLVLGRSLW